MAYVTSIERLAKLQTTKEMLLDVVSTRFKSVPEDISTLVNSIKAVDKLKSLFRQAITCESLDEFRKIVKPVE